MRILHVQDGGVTEYRELEGLPATVGAGGFVWIACSRATLRAHTERLQVGVAALTGVPLLDLHLSDLLNEHLPSRYDYTSQYDVLVFRRLAARAAGAAEASPGGSAAPAPRRRGPPILRRIDTSPVGFALFERVLLTVHPSECSIRETYVQRLLQDGTGEGRGAGVHLPLSPADLMLRICNLMVDAFLELRREMTHQLDHWQTELLAPHTRFSNWAALLDARLSLHQLDEVCEDQRAAVQDWIEALKTWPPAASAAARRERDLLEVRSRDVLEHIERVVHHVRRLEHSVETAVQIHFSIQGSRTNDIMRTLTVLTAIFLPLNLITGFFGMNFDSLPLIHRQSGIWLAVAAMVLVALALVALFWRKRYLERSLH